MLYCLSTCNQYSNRKFRELTQEFLNDDELQNTLAELNNALSLAAHTAVSQTDKRILRPIFHPYDPTRVLEMAGMLLPQNQVISFFIVREKKVLPPDGKMKS